MCRTCPAPLRALRGGTFCGTFSAGKTNEEARGTFGGQRASSELWNAATPGECRSKFESTGLSEPRAMPDIRLQQPTLCAANPNDCAAFEHLRESIGHQTYGHHTQLRGSSWMGEAHADAHEEHDDDRSDGDGQRGEGRDDERA
jgi:hypothetical protein